MTKKKTKKNKNYYQSRNKRIRAIKIKKSKIFEICTSEASVENLNSYQYIDVITGRITGHVGDEIDAVERPLAVTRKSFDFTFVKFDGFFRSKLPGLRQQQLAAVNHAIDLLHFRNLFECTWASVRLKCTGLQFIVLTNVQITT